MGRSPGGGHGNPLQYSHLENPYGQRCLEGYGPWSHKESDMTDWLSTAHSKHFPHHGSGSLPLFLSFHCSHPGPAMSFPVGDLKLCGVQCPHTPSKNHYLVRIPEYSLLLRLFSGHWENANYDLMANEETGSKTVVCIYNIIFIIFFCLPVNQTWLVSPIELPDLSPGVLHLFRKQVWFVRMYFVCVFLKEYNLVVMI